MGPIAKAVTEAINEWEHIHPPLIDHYQNNIPNAYRTFDGNSPECREEYIMHECMRRGKIAFYGIDIIERLELMREMRAE